MEFMIYHSRPTFQSIDVLQYVCVCVCVYMCVCVHVCVCEYVCVFVYRRPTCLRPPWFESCCLCAKVTLLSDGFGSPLISPMPVTVGLGLYGLMSGILITSKSSSGVVRSQPPLYTRGLTDSSLDLDGVRNKTLHGIMNTSTYCSRTSITHSQQTIG